MGQDSRQVPNALIIYSWVNLDPRIANESANTYSLVVVVVPVAVRCQNVTIDNK